MNTNVDSEHSVQKLNADESGMWLSRGFKQSKLVRLEFQKNGCSR